MNKDKELRFWHKLSIGLVILILAGGYFFKDYYKRSRVIKFMTEYLPYEAAVEEYDSAEYFDLDWQKTLAITIIESDCKQGAISYRYIYTKKGRYKKILAEGYKQIAPVTQPVAWKGLRKIKDMKGIGRFDPEFQMWGGNFLFRDILDNLALGINEKELYINALLIYNMGFTSFNTSGVRYRNYKYVQKWSRHYTAIKYAWKEF